VRISTLDTNNIKTALAQRYVILKDIINDETALVNPEEKYPFGVDVKMVREITQRQKILTPAEKDEVVAKYASGMNMTAIAEQCGCHYVTVKRLLRKREVELR